MHSASDPAGRAHSRQSHRSRPLDRNSLSPGKLICSTNGNIYPLYNHTSIGRSPQNDISILSPSVSQRHCEIVYEAPEGLSTGRNGFSSSHQRGSDLSSPGIPNPFHLHTLRDLGSLNGTYVNRKRVINGGYVGLKHGDTVRFGLNKLVFTFHSVAQLELRHRERRDKKKELKKKKKKKKHKKKGHGHGHDHDRDALREFMKAERTRMRNTRMRTSADDDVSSISFPAADGPVTIPLHSHSQSHSHSRSHLRRSRSFDSRDEDDDGDPRDDDDRSLSLSELMDDRNQHQKGRGRGRVRNRYDDHQTEMSAVRGGGVVIGRDVLRSSARASYENLPRMQMHRSTSASARDSETVGFSYGFEKQEQGQGQGHGHVQESDDASDRRDRTHEDYGDLYHRYPEGGGEEEDGERFGDVTPNRFPMESDDDPDLSDFQRGSSRSHLSQRPQQSRPSRRIVSPSDRSLPPNVNVSVPPRFARHSSALGAPKRKHHRRSRSGVSRRGRRRGRGRKARTVRGRGEGGRKGRTDKTSVSTGQRGRVRGRDQDGRKKRRKRGRVPVPVPVSEVSEVLRFESDVAERDPGEHFDAAEVDTETPPKHLDIRQEDEEVEEDGDGDSTSAHGHDSPLSQPELDDSAPPTELTIESESEGELELELESESEGELGAKSSQSQVLGNDDEGGEEEVDLGEEAQEGELFVEPFLSGHDFVVVEPVSESPASQEDGENASVDEEESLLWNDASPLESRSSESLEILSEDEDGGDDPSSFAGEISPQLGLLDEGEGGENAHVDAVADLSLSDDEERIPPPKEDPRDAALPPAPQTTTVVIRPNLEELRMKESRIRFLEKELHELRTSETEKLLSEISSMKSRLSHVERKSSFLAASAKNDDGSDRLIRDLHGRLHDVELSTRKTLSDVRETAMRDRLDTAQSIENIRGSMSQLESSLRDCTSRATEESRRCVEDMDSRIQELSKSVVVGSRVPDETADVLFGTNRTDPEQSLDGDRLERDPPRRIVGERIGSDDAGLTLHDDINSAYMLALGIRSRLATSGKEEIAPSKSLVSNRDVLRETVSLLRWALDRLDRHKDVDPESKRRFDLMSLRAQGLGRYVKELESELEILKTTLVEKEENHVDSELDGDLREMFPSLLEERDREIHELKEKLVRAAGTSGGRGWNRRMGDLCRKQLQELDSVKRENLEWRRRHRQGAAEWQRLTQERDRLESQVQEMKEAMARQMVEVRDLVADHHEQSTSLRERLASVSASGVRVIPEQSESRRLAAGYLADEAKRLSAENQSLRTEVFRLRDELSQVSAEGGKLKLEFTQLKDILRFSEEKDGLRMRKMEDRVRQNEKTCGVQRVAKLETLCQRMREALEQSRERERIIEDKLRELRSAEKNGAWLVGLGDDNCVSFLEARLQRLEDESNLVRPTRRRRRQRVIGEPAARENVDQTQPYDSDSEAGILKMLKARNETLTRLLKQTNQTTKHEADLLEGPKLDALRKTNREISEMVDCPSPSRSGASLEDIPAHRPRPRDFDDGDGLLLRSDPAFLDDSINPTPPREDPSFRDLEDSFRSIVRDDLSELSVSSAESAGKQLFHSGEFEFSHQHDDLLADSLLQ